MELQEELKKALEELRKEKQRKFDQTADLIVNLQKFNPKKDSVNIFVSLPNKIKDKKVAGFLEVRNAEIETITQEDFRKYSDKKALKKLVNNFDFFIAQASLMPKVATVFGKVLGPSGKMPSPQLGIIASTDAKAIAELKDKINKSTKLRTKESSIKIPIGKYSMDDKKIIENIMVIYNSLLKTLPRQKENIKNIEIKFTMSKPKKIKV
jgi:large subunit ribosomal protein L1